MTLPRFCLNLRARPPGVYLLGGLLLSLLWVYWPSFTEMADTWGTKSQYSHGYLVPVFSLYLLWRRRDLFSWEAPSSWGLPVLIAGLGLRLVGTYIYFDWLAAVSLLVCLAGTCLLVAGRPALRYAWPAIAFLLFMIPLPHRFEASLSQPLQRVGTIVSTYTLQTLGLVAYAEGNVIVLGDVRIGVVEACSGLNMLVSFFALCTAAVLIIERPPLERGLIFFSAIPIAIAANIIRIIVTALLHKIAGRELADLVFHDLAGYLMPLLGLAMVWIELRLLGWVLVPGRASGQGSASDSWKGMFARGTPNMASSKQQPAVVGGRA
jgi:exosortase